jgi:hypothetical protein
MPVMTGDTQSGVPSSSTTHFWSFPQPTCSQGLFAHWPVMFTHTLPARQAMAPEAHGWGLQVPVVVSQKESLWQVERHADFTQVPFAQVWPSPHVTPAQLGTHAPALQNCPAGQVLFAHGFTLHWRPMQLCPVGHPFE